MARVPQNKRRTGRNEYECKETDGQSGSGNWSFQGNWSQHRETFRRGRRGRGGELRVEPKRRGRRGKRNHEERRESCRRASRCLEEGGHRSIVCRNEESIRASGCIGEQRRYL